MWAVRGASRPVSWTLAAAFALLSAYACLVTFARGVYFSVAGSLVLLGLLLWGQRSGFNVQAFSGARWRRYRPEGWRVKGSLLLLLALTAEVAVVMIDSSFMAERLASTDRDLGSRTEHWRHGIELLESPADWLLGKGLGRLPANYASHVPRGEFSGDIKLGEGPVLERSPETFVTVQGPHTMEELGGLHALAQRVSGLSMGRHRVSLDIRIEMQTDVYLALCERHLLYDGACHAAFIRVLPGETPWQNLVVPLRGPALTGGPWYAPRLGVFSVSVVNAGGVADFDNVRLIGPHQRDLLANGNFIQGLAHWFPAAQRYFLPWHMDNLFLEVLIERGLIGLLLIIALWAYVLWSLVWGRARLQALSPYLAASLGAALLVGAVSSVMDVPRVAFLFFLLMLFSIQVAQDQHPS